ncbi:hypothetical protein LVQ79_22340, partial [Buttiauxella sp. A2-C1_F]|uniref:hypothetical protein n=1 Tax=Buttiauxella sp. A2-C1_F TaxID=2904526 RepID=UPI001E436DEC
VAYITLSSFRVKRLFSLFIWLTGRFVSRCAVSVEAQYRDFLGADKYKIQKTYRSIVFHSKYISRAHYRLVFKQKRAPQGPFLSFL